MQLSGSIQGCDVVMLVDSGSSHSFLSRVVAAQLQGVAPMSKVLHVQVANSSMGSTRVSVYI
jgi:hypothetical protein